jgi:hypothetical protein
MLYQLPNGKVITLSVEEYLDLTDADIQHLMAADAGESYNSPWAQSVIKHKVRQTNEDIDTSIDYESEDDEHAIRATMIEEVPLDDLPELPDSEYTDQ